MNKIQTARVVADNLLIAHLGGPSKVAELLGYEKFGGCQRVQNWTVRGIPSAVKVDRPDLFLVNASLPPNTPQGAQKGVANA